MLNTASMGALTISMSHDPWWLALDTYHIAVFHLNIERSNHSTSSLKHYIKQVEAMLYLKHFLACPVVLDNISIMELKWQWASFDHFECLYHSLWGSLLHGIMHKGAHTTTTYVATHKKWFGHKKQNQPAWFIISTRSC